MDLHTQWLMPKNMHQCNRGDILWQNIARKIISFAFSFNAHLLFDGEMLKQYCIVKNKCDSDEASEECTKKESSL